MSLLPSLEEDRVIILITGGIIFVWVGAFCDQFEDSDLATAAFFTSIVFFICAIIIALAKRFDQNR